MAALLHPVRLSSCRRWEDRSRLARPPGRSPPWRALLTQSRNSARQKEWGGPQDGAPAAFSAGAVPAALACQPRILALDGNPTLHREWLRLALVFRVR